MNAPAYSLFSSYFHSSSSRPAKYGTKRFLGGTILLLSLLVLGSWASAQTTPGARGRPLTFSDNAANSLPTVSLAETLSSPVSVSPARLTFASGAVGTKSGAQTVTLTNHLNTSLPVSPAVATGDFVVASNTCGSSVGPGRSCTVEVTFRPTVVGVRTGTLTLPYRASGSPIVIPLSGAGNANGLISLVVTPANPSIAAGSTQQFTATGTYSNGSTQNLTASVAWSSSAPGVATINAAGLASSVSPGSTTITATWVTITPLGRATRVTPGSPIINPPRSTISSSTTLTVTDPLLVSMAVTPANPSIAAGTTQQFTATGTYSNGSTQNLTSTAVWSSSAPGVATISNTSGSQGVASAVGPGQTTIAAASGAINGSTTLTVTAGFVLTGSLNTVRYYHTATLLNNGLVLMAGGAGYSGYLASAELYDPAIGTFTPSGSLNTARYVHTATLLNNGMVLIAGGFNSSGALASAELYNPATGAFTPTGSLNTARAQPTATLLNNGLVLIAGGYNSNGPLAGAELYNPTTGTFTSTGSLNTPREQNTATLLNNGMVLVAGGSGSSGYLANAELYNPATGTFTYTGSLNTARVWHTATLLNNGLVLMAGGYGAVGAYIGPSASAELYNPATGTFSYTTGSLTTARYSHTATLLNNGLVLMAGGWGPSGILASAELYNPATGTFTSTGNLNTARELHTATLLNNGPVLIAGGYGSSGALAGAELYEPATLTPPSLVSISLAPSSPTVPLDTALRFSAFGTFSGGSTEQLAEVTWSSSNPEVISISDDASNPGAAYAAAAGAATVSACAGAVCGSTTVTVGPRLVSIAVTPASATVAPGLAVQFYATGISSDGSSQDLTSSVT